MRTSRFRDRRDPAGEGTVAGGGQERQTLSPAALEALALRYLERYAPSVAGFRRHLAAKAGPEAAAAIEALIGRYLAAGILDDARYAEQRAAGLNRRGVSARAIEGRLAAKGIDRESAASALAALGEDPDLAAAHALARRRRLGPYRVGARAENRDRDMAALGRAGFAWEIARRVIDAEA
jgi:regulatory protein